MSVLRRTGRRMGRRVGHRVAWQFADRLWRRFPSNSPLCQLATWSLIITLAATSQAADYVQVSSLFRTGEYAECIEAAAQAITQDEVNENFRLLKINSELELGRYADALTSLEAALKRLPTSIRLRWVGRDVCRFNNQPER